MDASNDGSFRISGRYGEVWIVQRAVTFADGTAIPGPPVNVKLMEVESIEATVEENVEDVNLPGTGDIGFKIVGATRNGTMTVQHITTEWQAYQKRTAHSTSLAERRRARDKQQRLDRSMILQIWNDDDSALGAEGWQIKGVQFTRLTMGFTQDLLNRELPFRFTGEDEIRGFQRLGNQVDPVTGLPAISYYVGAPAVV